MLAEFYHLAAGDREPPEASETPPKVVATARWDGSAAVIETEDPEVGAALERVFRAAPVVTDDASLRTLGTHGPVVLQPGSLEWFRAAALSRAPEHGLAVRFVPGVLEGGYDPAGQYRGFGDVIRRLEAPQP